MADPGTSADVTLVDDRRNTNGFEMFILNHCVTYNKTNQMDAKRTCCNDRFLIVFPILGLRYCKPCSTQ